MQGNDPISYAKNILKQKTDQSTLKSIYDTVAGDTTRADGTTFNYKIPVAAGLAAGAYTAGQPRDTLPIDTTGINFQTAQEAMDDPNLRFKPKLEDTQLAAQGGRIGYDIGKLVDPKIPKKLKPDTDNILEKLEKFIKEREGYEDAIFRSERIDAAEGGLMNLGGMEKDYRQEGGFVPIGGKEKADDVPAMLSKNGFGMTADAVKGAGGGNVEKGAQKMYNTMKQLEGRIA